MIHQITMGVLNEHLTPGAILIDVRDSLEYQMGHLKEAINIPYQSILEKTKNLPKNTKMILYCSTGRRSKLACQLLLSMGYTNLYDLGSVRVNES